jgi:hypothetical protein
MSLKIHVFIATNKGLVALQNMIDLNDSALQSVITIKGSTDLASISPAYHRFVQKATGLIQKEFGGESFRTNISRNIDQGSSWQLPFYIAHFVNALDNSSVQLGNGIVQTGDIAIIATGQINTSSGLIESVNLIPDKYITASAQIKVWMKKEILVEFFVPANNHSNQLPELDCVIYPVLNTHQAREHVEQLLPMNLKLDDHRAAKQTSDIIINSDRVASSKSIEAMSKKVSLNHNQDKQRNAPSFSRLSELVDLIMPLKMRMLLVIVCTVGIMLVFSVREYLISNHSADASRMLITKKSGAYCDTNAMSQLTRVSKQYVSRLPSIALSETCSILLITAANVPQVWLVADTKALIELAPKLIDGELQWTIPIPNQQHANRDYILILTHEYLDLADLAAFKTRLSRLEKNQRPSIELLAEFFSQIDVNPQYISQKLVAKN